MVDYSRELLSAKGTLNLSDRVASSFVKHLGALAPILLPPLPAAHFGRRPSFQMTVLDDKYWFAKLYQLITYFEILNRASFEHAGFVMHFIPVFYDLYYVALQNYQAKAFDKVSGLWMEHFRGLVTADEPGSMEGVKHSIRTGVTAHVQGDMAKALESAYRSWKASPKPEFEVLKKDFFEKNRPTFDSAKAAFFLDLNDKSPSPLRPEVGQLVIATGEKAIGGGLAVEEVYKWRNAAWQQASFRLRF